MDTATVTHSIDPIDFCVRRIACFHGSSLGTIMKSTTTTPTTSQRMINLQLIFCNGEQQPTRHTTNGYPCQRHAFLVVQTPRCIDAFNTVRLRTSWCWMAGNIGVTNLVGMESKLPAKSSCEGAGQCLAPRRNAGCIVSCSHRTRSGTFLR